MLFRRTQRAVLVLSLTGMLGAAAVAQELTGGESLMDKINAFLPIDHSRPMTVAELCHRLDCLNDELRNDGLIVMKQPDVFSQARLTRFRNDVDQQMSSDLGNFQLVLAARINRLDSATTTSTTALGASLAAPGTTNVGAPPSGASTGAMSVLSAVDGSSGPNGSGGPNLFSGGATPSAFSALLPASSKPSGSASPLTGTLGLGVEPTVYLDEKKRFLEHLNQIRRINMGPDQNDSSGYGLYLVRLPVSITPGECTYQGHGAELALTVHHEFTPEFLPQTFKNLVINDVVDQISPVVYEAIRSGALNHVLIPRHKAREAKRVDERRVALLVSSLRGPINLAAANKQLPKYIMRTGLPVTDKAAWTTVADRMTAVLDAGRAAAAAAAYSSPVDSTDFSQRISEARRGVGIDDAGGEFIKKQVALVNQATIAAVSTAPAALEPASSPDPYAKFHLFMTQLYATALPDDVKILDDILGLDTTDRTQITNVLANDVAALDALLAKGTESDGKNNITLPSVRSAKQAYPIAPREIRDFLLDENLYLLAKDAQEASRFKITRAQEVRDYMRHTLETAWYAMVAPSPRDPSALPLLADDAFLHTLIDAIKERRFGPNKDGGPLRLEDLYEVLISRLEEGRDNVRGRAIGALCWAVALDAAVLDSALREDARKMFMEKGLPSEGIAELHFHYPRQIPNDAAREAFQKYVELRWPVVTFALDPVTDQQNIADSFSLNRDLQLAVSFAFATGQINFSQLDTFRRQIQQSADTIALNRTVTGFVHGNDIFGFRFTPRFQNPPNQRTNIGVIASQLIGGGPGPDYQTKKSKLEPGMRELTAVLLMPTFLTEMRLDVAGNWFKLNDPEHLIFHTNRMLERGRRVSELRQAAETACRTKEYREADLRVLRSKLAQLDAMLPMQTKVVRLPFDNSASGFDLFSEGSTALVPELTGFSGVDTIQGVAQTASGGSGTGTPATGPSFSIGTLSGNTPTQSVTITGGATSLGDVFVFGRYINLLDTRVFAGGRAASFEILSREVVHVQIPFNAIPTTTDDGTTQYIEIFLATPNGISNSVLIPYSPPAAAAAPAPAVAFNVDSGSQSFPISYQWLAGSDGKYSLVATQVPSGKMAISWDTNSGIAPKRIQAQFSANVGSQTINFVMQSDAANTDNYKFDAGQFTVTLLKRLQDITVYPAIPTSPIVFTVGVQPWTPADSEGVRVESKPKTLQANVTVPLQYLDTGTNALPNVAPAQIPPPQTKSAKGTSWLEPGAEKGQLKVGLAGVGKRDAAVSRTAQVGSERSKLLSVPDAAPLLETAPLLQPNLGTEAEQVAKILTGQTLRTTVSIPPPVVPSFDALQSTANGLKATATSDATAAISSLNAATSAATQAAAAQIVTAQAAISKAPSVVVTPSPVVVVSPPPVDTHKKHKPSRVRQAITRFGNRVSQAVPQ